MDNNLFPDLPFNLAGETQSAELTAEAEQRIRALAEREARKQQTLLFDTGFGFNPNPDPDPEY